MRVNIHSSNLTRKLFISFQSVILLISILYS